MKINQNFLGGGGMQNKKPSVGGVWIFSGTAHFEDAWKQLGKFGPKFSSCHPFPSWLQCICSQRLLLTVSAGAPI